MKVSTLKGQLQSSSGGTFSLAAAALVLPGVKALIEACLGGALTIGGSRPDLQALTVEGTGTVDSMKDRPIKVWFSTDAAAENVTGILIACQAVDWSIKTGFLEFDGSSYLHQYSVFTSLALALSARPEDRTDTNYGVGVGVYVKVDGRQLFFHGCVPPKQRIAPKADIILRGYFSGLSLGLDKLPQFISGYTFTRLLPDTIPLAKEFELRSVWYVVNPTLKFITAVGLEVRSAHPWVLVEDRFEFEYVDVRFTITTPGVGTTVFWALKADMKIGSDVEVVAGLDSNLELHAELAEPVPIKPLLDRYAPAADLDFTIASLRLGLAFADSPPSWSASLALDGSWPLLDKVQMEECRVSIDGHGTSLDQVTIGARLSLGDDAEFFLKGELNRGAGWDFTGSMTHDYNVQIVSNPDWDPLDPDNDNQPLKTEQVAGQNPTHFFSSVSDALFPGSSTSGVPPMLDVDIETLEVEFNTKTKDFHFQADVEFGKDVEAVLTFSNLHQEGSKSATFEKRATGVITVLPGKPDAFEFDLGIDLKPDSKHFVALYNDTNGRTLSLGDLVKGMFPDAGSLSQIPDFSLTLKDAIVGYASAKQGEKTVAQSIFAIDLEASIDLSSLGDIPLIGQSLSAAKTLKLAFQMVYPALPTGVQAFTKADLAAINDLITIAGPRLPADEDLSALSLKTELRLGDGDPIDVKLPVSIDKSTGQLQNSGGTFDPPPGAQPTDDGVKWIQINKQFGPVHLQRAGFKFDQGEVTALLDGGLSAFGLEVDLMGLSVSSKITGVAQGKFDPRFGLQGFGVSFAKGGVAFAGAFLHLKVGDVDQYDGLASVQAEGLRLAAIGSLTTVNDQTSLFLYAVLDYPLGGPPFLYVTGLAGGFGLNQAFVMPTVDQVADFPLIQAAKQPPAMPTDPGSAGPFITQELQNIDLRRDIGQYFGCAGIRFTSFELLDSIVLISLSFGREFELDLLGVSTLVVPSQLPPGEPPLAVVSLQIVGSFIPDQGLALVQGLLTTDSHILDPQCHLTGGFAFGTWFGPNANAGDFVITVGGYHPEFQKPAHYPTVPRVGINWQISSELVLTGGLYFALTPRALMAGGAMHAVFQTSLDLTVATVDVKAWFTIGADFIVYWKPFHYGANLYVAIGIDVVIHFCGTHDIGLDAGADLQIWGPAFGGRAHVDVSVIGIRIAFDIGFGASPPTPGALDWDNTDATKSFRKSFLPTDDKIVSIAIASGLVRTVAVAKAQDRSGHVAAAHRGVAARGDDQNEVWSIINPTEFCVRTSSVIPIKQCDTAIPFADEGHGLQGAAGNAVFGIAPMNKGHDKVGTFHQISVTSNGASMASHLMMRPILQHVPGGLWAETNSGDINAALLIENAIVGYEIVPGSPTVSGHSQPIKRDLLNFTTQPIDNAYTDEAIDAFTATASNPGDDPAKNADRWNRIQEEIHQNSTRDAMLAAMGFGRADLDIGEAFSTDAAYAPSYGSLTR